MLSHFPAVIDASTLINLAATERLAEMLLCVANECSISRVVKGECLYIRSADGSQIEPVEPTRWIDAGILAECQLTEDEEDRFVMYAAAIDDGEAMSIAIAQARGYTLVTDDRKAKNIANDAHIPTITTAAIVKAWSLDKTDGQIAQVVLAIENRARFRPPEDDPDYEWWLEHRGQ